jgi:DNA-binding transcriptional LysR family regulator
VLREGHPLAEHESLQPRDVVGEPWIYVEGADPRTRAFWSLEEFRDEPLRTGTRVNSFEEAFAAVLAGLAITCQGESAIRTVGAAFPQLRPVPLEGVEPARVAARFRSFARRSRRASALRATCTHAKMRSSWSRLEP